MTDRIVTTVSGLSKVSSGTSKTPKSPTWSSTPSASPDLLSPHRRHLRQQGELTSAAAAE